MESTGAEALESTSKAGQPKIQQDMTMMKQDLDDHRAQVTSARDTLETCLNKLNEYQHSYDTYAAWLQDMDEQMRKPAELQASTEDKQKELQRHQVSS